VAPATIDSEELQDILEEHECLVMEEYAEALVGVVWRFGLEPVALYDYDKIISLIIEKDGATYEEAHEHFSYNIEGAWVGDKTPAFCRLSKKKT